MQFNAIGISLIHILCRLDGWGIVFVYFNKELQSDSVLVLK